MFKNLWNLLFRKSDVEKIVLSERKLHKSLIPNIVLFKDIFQDIDSMIYRKIETRDRVKCCLIFADEMIDKNIIKNILKQLHQTELPGDCAVNNRLDYFEKHVLVTNSLEKIDNIDQIVSRVLSGDSLLLVDGVKDGVILNSQGWEKRAITPPESENVVRGPREGFTESLSVNMSLIRRRIKSRNLKFKYQTLGERTRTKICICYIEGLASKKILKELQHRLDQIEIGGILESGYIEEFIKDSPLGPFKTIGHTERPDIVAAKLLEGRIGIICDGTPIVLTLPFIFLENFQANEDYYKNYAIASIDRFSRFISFILTTSTPAIYLSLVTYHQEMVPTPLLLNISASRQGVPFPTVFEAVLLGFIFELLREGGVRLPTPVGQAVSIVGAIILGDAAVTAKLVSAPMIIVTALTGIAGFMTPSMFGLIICLRIIFLILASLLGLYGYLFGVMALFIQLMSMRSFGIPYMLTFGALEPQTIKDTIIRAPWWYMYLRPKLIGKNDQKRQQDMKMPKRR